MYVSVCMCVPVCVCMCVSVYLCVCVCVCVCECEHNMDAAIFHKNGVKRGIICQKLQVASKSLALTCVQKPKKRQHSQKSEFLCVFHVKVEAVNFLL